MKNPPNWGLTLVGVVLVIIAGALIAGCQPPDPPMPPEKGSVLDAPGPQNIPFPATPERQPVTREMIEGGPPEGADEGNLGDPDNVDLTPQTTRDPNWDCEPTGNSAIDDWKRNAKCGGRLDGE